MSGAVIVVTGASQGIGAALAEVFAENLPGCRLVLIARSEKRLKQVAQRCRRLGAGLADPWVCDVSDAAQVETLASAVLRRHRTVDVLINNAGVFRGTPFLECTVEAFDSLLAANLRSVFLVSRAFAPAMVRRGRGHIFNMSSIAGLQAYPNGAGYCAAKFGVTGLSRVMRAELKDKGVRVTVVHPGATDSPSWDGSGVARQRMMPARDVARSFLDIFRLSRRTVVEEIILRPQRGDV